MLSSIIIPTLGIARFSRWQYRIQSGSAHHATYIRRDLDQAATVSAGNCARHAANAARCKSSRWRTHLPPSISQTENTCLARSTPTVCARVPIGDFPLHLIVDSKLNHGTGCRVAKPLKREVSLFTIQVDAASRHGLTRVLGPREEP